MMATGIQTIFAIVIQDRLNSQVPTGICTRNKAGQAAQIGALGTRETLQVGIGVRLNGQRFIDLLNSCPDRLSIYRTVLLNGYFLLRRP
jgi:hypothetical protein